MRRKFLHGKIVAGSFGSGFASDETTPSFVAFVNDLGRILSVLRFTRESKRIFGLAVGDLVNPDRFRQQTGL
jgi:hypothetical protein